MHGHKRIINNALRLLYLNFSHMSIATDSFFARIPLHRKKFGKIEKKPLTEINNCGKINIPRLGVIFLPSDIYRNTAAEGGNTNKN